MITKHSIKYKKIPGGNWQCTQGTLNGYGETKESAYINLCNKYEQNCALIEIRNKKLMEKYKEERKDILAEFKVFLPYGDSAYGTIRKNPSPSGKPLIYMNSTLKKGGEYIASISELEEFIEIYQQEIMNTRTIIDLVRGESNVV